jgi:hypothetical protein
MYSSSCDSLSVDHCCSQTNREAEEVHFSVEERVTAKAELDEVEDELVDLVR